MLTKIKNGIRLIYAKPNLIGIFILVKLSFLFPDKIYLQLMYWLKMGKKLDLKNPITFNEKLQWLKLYNHNPLFTVMVDKVKAKEYVASIIGEEHIIPTLGVWDSPDDIDFNELPNQFVLKCNHNSGIGMCICRDKNNLNIDNIKVMLRKGLKENYFMKWREWPYKNVPRKILAEKFMVDTIQKTQAQTNELTDYKWFCFNGEPFMMYVSHDNAEHATTDFFDMNYHRLTLQMKDPNSDNPPTKPKEFEEMKEYAKLLSKHIPFLRVDFYVINHRVYFGELTFFHNAGFCTIKPDEWNVILGDMIKINV